MNIFYKKNNELTDSEIEVLYQLYYENIAPYTKTYVNRKNLSTLQHKEEWMNAIKENNSLVSILCVDNSRLVGFILLSFLPEENYINEFHICRDYQNDGMTFKNLVKYCFQISQPNKDFCGRIWKENKEAKQLFLKLGATGENGKYRLKYNKALELINNL
ncbi:MAG: hypothetical protein J6A52_07840 [Bacilli bacterium]|nr:hypothetical protein [Bacilli bacterium]